MLNNCICPRCEQKFSSSQRLNSHLERKIPCKQLIVSQSSVANNLVCRYCNKSFARQYNLDRHLNENRCKMIKKPLQLKVTLALLEKQLDEKEKQIAELKQTPISPHNKENAIELKSSKSDSEKFKQLEERIETLEKNGPKVVNNNLQIVCIGNNDNYLDMLTEQCGSFEKALEYIKDCALSHLTGDCKLLEKIYMNNGNETGPKSIRFTDKSRTKIEYRNENNEIVRDTKELFGRKLANNLQKSYLKGVNFLLTRNLESRGCPNKFLEEYDLQTWNGHIYELSDIKYHKKIINQLNISETN